MLKKVLIGLAVAILALVGVIASRPSTYHVERSATVAAPADVVFAQVNDFHKWNAWSPWDKMDPNQKVSFDGPESGQGAKYGWSGNDQVGEGRMTIEESKAGELVRIKLEFLRPWESTSPTTFTFKAVEGGTQVTWAMDGTHNFAGKAFSLFMDMDGMLGADFDKGLASMKAVAEAEAKKLEEARKVAEAEAAKKAAAAAAGIQPAAAPVAETTE
jgi:Polyketide cyclase / dehydrase and lipid transport